MIESIWILVMITNLSVPDLSLTSSSQTLITAAYIDEARCLRVAADMNAHANAALARALQKGGVYQLPTRNECRKVVLLPRILLQDTGDAP